MKLVLIAIGLAGSALFFSGRLPGVACSGEGDPSQPLVSYYGNGNKKSVAEYVDGKRTGHSEQYYPDGRIECSGRYEDGLREGRWEFWNEDGTLDAARTGTYRAGKRIGE